MPNVFLLKPGSIIRDESGSILDARSSVTLVVSGSKKIIVDTGLIGEEGQIIEALEKKCMKSEDIDILINTHSHPDHCGNNYLFSRAKLLHPKEGEIIAPGVSVIETPGHTYDSISVIVDAADSIVGYVQDGRSMDEKRMPIKKLAIAGDALPTFNNFIKSIPPAFHVDRRLAILSMARIISIVGGVIPGHDLPFSIPERKYIKLSD
ncbi:MAG: MBL fold metallo-hydrolase [Methanotrichaceae archaeon]